MPTLLQGSHKISCVVPVFNEASRINGVLNSLTGHPLLDEIIVVNDGSSDQTHQVVSQRDDVIFISYPVNRGKTHALKEGIERAKNDLIMTVDSDLIGLRPENISELIMPILEDRADVSLSLRGNSLLIFKILGIDFVSGERVFSRRILGLTAELDNLWGFAFESFMNKIIVQDKLRISSVNWPNVIQQMKYKKQGLWSGIRADIKMVKKIVSYLGPLGLIKQYAKMMMLKV